MRAPWDSIGIRSWFAQCRHGGGSSSSASTSQQTSNQDNRAAADTGSVSASGGASLSNVAVYNTSSDPATILSALRSVEHIARGIAGTAIAGGVQQSAVTGDIAGTAIAGGVEQSAIVAGTVSDLASAALHENNMLSQDAINQWAQVVGNEGARAGQSIHDAISALADNSNLVATSTSKVASNALSTASDFISNALNIIGQALSSLTAQSARSTDLASQALGDVAAQNTSTNATAAQALGEISPLQTTLKVVVYAIAAVAIVFFLSRSKP